MFFEKPNKEFYVHYAKIDQKFRSSLKKLSKKSGALCKN